jgi:hypothetical protein
MKRLIEKGLMFGNLVPVDSAALVERYNRALKHLTGKETRLPDFHIDISGYSPEVGDELSDHLYLNPNGVNRQFILLTTAQKTAPLLNAMFSTSRGILRAFIEENEPQLFALTARDAVAGELEGTVFDLSTPARLFDIRRITVRADTTTAQVAEGRRLSERIARFRTEPDAWWDDVLIAEMISLAKLTGDVTRNPIDLPASTYEQANFWTAHFGGLYLFRGLAAPAAISVGPKARLGPLPIETVLDFSDRNGIARFLEANELVEPIVKARGVDAAAILHQKMDFVLLEAADALGVRLEGATRRDLRRFAAELGTALPEEVLGLAALLRWVEGGGPWPRITSEHPAYFYSLRARAHADRDLVNMLLSELAPLDVRQLFICHKPAFYAAYAGWSDAKKSYVADFLAREYQIDKAGTRAALFGPEPGMEEPAPAGAGDDLVGRVGPWGAVRRPNR